MYTGYFGLLSVQNQSEAIQCISDFRQDCVTSATYKLLSFRAAISIDLTINMFLSGK